MLNSTGYWHSGYLLGLSWPNWHELFTLIVNDSNEESFSSGDFLARKYMLCSERIHVRVSCSHVLMNILQPALLIGCMGGEIGLVLFAISVV